MASIREVAKLAHVAPSTVSRALNGSGYVSEQKRKTKIKKAVEELDYIPNQWIRNLYKQKNGYYRCYDTGYYPSVLFQLFGIILRQN